jgi:oligopeptide/dipeptide ABC transporter ATP-binding protein
MILMSAITCGNESIKLFLQPITTRMLMASVPRLDQHWEKLSADVERKTRQLELRHGCVYFDRCPVADIALGCRYIQPEPVEVEKGYFVACFRATTG